MLELQHDGDVRSLSFSPLGDMLAGGGADDTNGLMTHKTRRNEMKVGFRQVSPDKTHFNQGGLIFSMAMFTLSLSLLVENSSLWEAKI